MDNVIAAIKGGTAELAEVEEWTLQVARELTEQLVSVPNSEVEAVAYVMTCVDINVSIKVRTNEGESPREALQEHLG